MKKLFFSCFFFLSFTALLNAQPSAATTGLRVEVMVFSGRPNPVFTITDPTQVREILNLAETASGANPESSAVKQGLGYRGILVTNLSPDDTSDIQNIRVYRSAAGISRKSATNPKNESGKSAANVTPETRSDNSKALEARLLAMAHSAGAIDQRLLNQITAK
jgi:hypothetical protein